MQKRHQISLMIGERTSYTTEGSPAEAGIDRTSGHGHDEIVPTKSRRPQLSPSINSHSLNDDCHRSVVVAGSLAVDLSCNYVSHDNSIVASQPQLHTSNPSSITQSIGGVGSNVATSSHYMGISVSLCSIVADDMAGSTALSSLVARGISTQGIRTISGNARTAQYVAVNNDDGTLLLAMADMDILEGKEDRLHESWQRQLDLCKPGWLVVDTNWHETTFQAWLDAGKASGAKIAVEPVSVAKSRRIFSRIATDSSSLQAIPNNALSLATPNVHELSAMHEAAASAGYFEREDWFHTIDTFGLPSSGSRPILVSMTDSYLVDKGVPQQCIRLLPFLPCILTTLGEHGVLMTQILRPGDNHLTSPSSARYILSRATNGSNFVGGIYMRLFPPSETVPVQEVISVNGVGDTFLGVIIAGLAQKNPKDIVDLVDIAQKASVLTLKSPEAVNPGISSLTKAL